MNILLKEALKESVRYPWHKVFVMGTEQAGITYCVKNSADVKLFSITKSSHFDRAKRRVLYDYSMTIYSNPVVNLTGDAEKVDLDGIYQCCEKRINSPVATASDYNFMSDATVRFLKQNQR